MAVSSSLFLESHGGCEAGISVCWLDPLVAHLSVRDVGRVLSADLAVVMHLVTKLVGVVAVVDCLSCRRIASVE